MWLPSRDARGRRLAGRVRVARVRVVGERAKRGCSSGREGRRCGLRGGRLRARGHACLRRPWRLLRRAGLRRYRGDLGGVRVRLGGSGHGRRRRRVRESRRGGEVWRRLGRRRRSRRSWRFVRWRRGVQRSWWRVATGTWGARDVRSLSVSAGRAASVELFGPRRAGRRRNGEAWQAMHWAVERRVRDDGV